MCVASDGRLENVERAVEAIEAEVKRNSDIDLESKLKQAAEMVLEPLVEEEAPLTPTTDALQTKANTCLIPIPVYDSVVKEWSTTSPSEQWMGSAGTAEKECDIAPDTFEDVCKNREGKIEPHESVEEHQLAVIEADLPSDTQYALEMPLCEKERPSSLKFDINADIPLPEVHSPVRKRQSNVR